MERVILVHGMKRSGNHGIIHWLEAHDQFVFFNNVIPISPILTGERLLPPPEAFRAWLQEQPLTRAEGNYAAEVGEILSLYKEGSDHEERSVIASLEDHDLRVRPFHSPPREATNVLILRDPYNMLASRIRKASSADDPAYPTRPGPGMDRIVALWKAHAREFLGLTDHLENRICIYFNSWYSNLDYRRHISRQFGFRFTDNGFKKVSRIGGGSSFSGTEATDNQDLDVLNRHRYLTGSERELLEGAMADEELQELAHRVASLNPSSDRPDRS